MITISILLYYILDTWHIKFKLVFRHKIFSNKNIFNRLTENQNKKLELDTAITQELTFIRTFSTRIFNENLLPKKFNDKNCHDKI
jgi:hypothetical protein